MKTLRNGNLLILAWALIATLFLAVMTTLAIADATAGPKPGAASEGDLVIGEYYLFYEDISGSRPIGGRDVLVSNRLSLDKPTIWALTLPARWHTLPTNIVRRGEPTVPGVVKVSQEESGLVYDFRSINPEDTAITLPNPLSKDP